MDQNQVRNSQSLDQVKNSTYFFTIAFEILRNILKKFDELSNQNAILMQQKAGQISYKNLDPEQGQNSRSRLQESNRGTGYGSL